MATLREELESLWEAQQANEKMAREKRQAVQKRNELPLGGKATVMKEVYPGNTKAAEQAYDAVQNLDESMAEDAEERARIAKRKRYALPVLTPGK